MTAWLIGETGFLALILLPFLKNRSISLSFGLDLF